MRGLYYTPISTHLKQSEIEYVVRDCGAKILLADERFAPVLEALPADLRARCATVFVGAGGLDDLISTFREAVALPVVPMGKDFFYLGHHRSAQGHQARARRTADDRRRQGGMECPVIRVWC